ncbi:hypothetical protein Tco_0571141 [Tanacetum coccineum]
MGIVSASRFAWLSSVQAYLWIVMYKEMLLQSSSGGKTAIDYKHYEGLRKVDTTKLWLDEKYHLSNVLKQLDDAKNLLDKMIC